MPLKKKYIIQAIVDPSSGEQPLTNEEKTVILTVNGEIYNHTSFRKEFEGTYKFKTQSDCEPIIPLYEKYGPLETAKKLDGMFSFVLYDKAKNTFMAARDPVGITPLYFGRGKDGSYWFASEMKAFHDQCTEFQVFPPGHIYTKEHGFQRYYNPVWMDEKYMANNDIDYKLLRETFERAVEKRLMCDVPFGLLISGGLDSSLVASIAVRYNKKMLEQGDTSGWKNIIIDSYSIGLEGSPDLIAARKVANYLKTKHHELTFTVEQGLDAIRDVIWHLESYDVTTIRASTPMFIMSRKVKAFGTKMVLSGEGADEIFGG